MDNKCSQGETPFQGLKVLFSDCSVFAAQVPQDVLSGTVSCCLSLPLSFTQKCSYMLKTKISLLHFTDSPSKDQQSVYENSLLLSLVKYIFRAWLQTCSMNAPLGVTLQPRQGSASSLPFPVPTSHHVPSHLVSHRLLFKKHCHVLVEQHA